MKWLIELIKAIIAFITVQSKQTDSDVGSAVKEFLGTQLVDEAGVNSALANLSAEIGGAAVNEAVDFVQEHKGTLFSMTKNELSFMFEKLFNRKGDFDDAEYKALLKTFDDEKLVAEIESNAQEAAKIAGRVDAKKAMAADLKHKLNVLARFALAKAISIASHGIL